MIIRDNGNVGIGTTAPNAKLEVAGDIVASGQFVSSAKNMYINDGGCCYLVGRGNGDQSNSALGYATLWQNTGVNNTGMGNTAFYNNLSGSENVGIGSAALGNNISGNNNSGLGLNALATNTTGSNNTAIGWHADVLSGNLTNATAIGYNAIVGASNSLVLGNGVNVGIGTSTPATTLQVNGSLSLSTRTFSGTQSLLSTDYLVISTGAAATWTWPASPTNGRILIIVNHGTGAITTSSAYRTAIATTTSTIAIGTTVQLVYDGSEWRKIN